MLVGAATVIIVFAIVITAAVQGPQEKAFSQIITVGPVWSTNIWTCTSDADFIIHGALRGIGDIPQIAVAVNTAGTQSFYTLNVGDMTPFTVGGPAGSIISITRTGTVTGFLTLQTISDATASCTQ